jgi:hypothetical protein
MALDMGIVRRYLRRSFCRRYLRAAARNSFEKWTSVQSRVFMLTELGETWRSAQESNLARQASKARLAFFPQSWCAQTDSNGQPFAS